MNYLLVISVTIINMPLNALSKSIYCCDAGVGKGGGKEGSTVLVPS